MTTETGIWLQNRMVKLGDMLTLLRVREQESMYIKLTHAFFVTPPGVLLVGGERWYRTPEPAYADSGVHALYMRQGEHTWKHYAAVWAPEACLTPAPYQITGVHSVILPYGPSERGSKLTAPAHQKGMLMLVNDSMVQPDWLE